MFEVVILALAAGVAVMTGALYLCLIANIHLFRLTDIADTVTASMTLIKPVRGLDDELASNFESMARSDTEGRLQIIIAMESESDPAYPIAKAFAQAHPDRDITVLVTGPSGQRMGKTHNMIEALKIARHPYIVFSDADITVTPQLLAETSRAFTDGYDAAYALPRHRQVEGLGGLLFQAALNHSFGLPVALTNLFDCVRFSAGAWMAFTRQALEKAGGLEPIANAIADDFALSSRVAAAGARARLLPVPVSIKETGTSLKDTITHLSKWSVIIRWTLPRFYLILPLLNLGVLAAALLILCEASGRYVHLGRSLAMASFLSRGLVALMQDTLAGEGPLPLHSYLLLTFADLIAFGFWISGFRSHIDWRGVRYRLYSGGRAEIVTVAAP